MGDSKDDVNGGGDKDDGGGGGWYHTLESSGVVGTSFGGDGCWEVPSPHAADNSLTNASLGYSQATFRVYNLRPDGSRNLLQSDGWWLPPLISKYGWGSASDFNVRYAWWNPGFRKGTNRRNGTLQWKFWKGDSLFSLSLTLAVMFRTLSRNPPRVHARRLAAAQRCRVD